MNIVKELRIEEVKATRASNAPYQIILQGSRFGKGQEEPCLTLDKTTCDKYHIPIALDLVGKILICTFQSHELPIKQEKEWKGYVDLRSAADDHLQIKMLKRVETSYPLFNQAPPMKYEKSVLTLELSSFGEGDGMHFHVLPCPFYHVLELTEAEYEVCKLLPVNSVFIVSFKLRD